MLMETSLEAKVALIRCPHHNLVICLCSHVGLVALALLETILELHVERWLEVLLWSYSLCYLEPHPNLVFLPKQALEFYLWLCSEIYLEFVHGSYCEFSRVPLELSRIYCDRHELSRV